MRSTQRWRGTGKHRFSSDGACGHKPATLSSESVRQEKGQSASRAFPDERAKAVHRGWSQVTRGDCKDVSLHRAAFRKHAVVDAFTHARKSLRILAPQRSIFGKIRHRNADAYASGYRPQQNQAKIHFLFTNEFLN